MDLGDLQRYFTDPAGMLLIGSVTLLVVAVGMRALRKEHTEAPDGPDMRWWRADRRFVTQYDM